MNILLVVYDNDSYIHMFPHGIAYIAAVLKKAGHDITIYNQDVNHYPDEHLSKYLDENKFDMVGIGVIGGYYQYSKLIGISNAINNSKNRPKYYVLGGHGPSPEPEYFMRKTSADMIVIGEGEETIVDLTNQMQNNREFSKVKGIAYRDGDKCIVNQRRETIKDIDNIPWPAYDLFPIEYYRLLRMPNVSRSGFMMTVLSARGCTFKCNFCYRMDPGYRPRSPESVLEEIEYLQKRWLIDHIDFNDELLMSSKSRVLNFCDAIEKSGLKFKWLCNGRLNYAVPEVLKRMKDTGCVFINYGIESLDDKVLSNMNKKLTYEQIVSGVEATLNLGMSPGLNVIFGNIGDNKKTMQKGVDFIRKYGDASQMRTIRPVTPYPGSPLYNLAIENGLLDGPEDFYEKRHLNSDLISVNFTELSDAEFYETLLDANTQLINDYYAKSLKDALDQTNNLYKNQDKGFRGFRRV